MPEEVRIIPFKCIDCGTEQELHQCSSKNYPKYYPRFCPECSDKSSDARSIETFQHESVDGALYAIRAAEQLGIYTDELLERTEQLIDKDVEYYLKDQPWHDAH